MSDIQIIDNFLPEKEFNNILDVFITKGFPWYIADISDYNNDNNTQLFHILYNNNVPFSDYFNKLQPIYNKLNIFSLYKVRMIATMKSEDKKNLYHTDLEFLNSKNNNVKTAVYYFNSNDGGTEFEHNGQIVESVSNRMIIFPHHLKHRTVKHTKGDPFRYVLNLNYVELN